MAVPQITIRLAAAAKTEFDRYAASVGLRSSELAKLLIVREQRQKRLAKLRDGDNLDLSIVRASREVGTVTAHVSSVEQVADFDIYARSCGLNRNGAGAWLLEKELRERWLDAALSADK